MEIFFSVKIILNGFEKLDRKSGKNHTVYIRVRDLKIGENIKIHSDSETRLLHNSADSCSTSKKMKPKS